MRVSGGKPRRSAVLMLGAFLLSGCSAFMLGYTLDEYDHRTLSPDSEDGRYRLAPEAKVDSTLRGYLKDHGDPDFFRVLDTDRLYLLYVREDLAVELVRSSYNTASEVTLHRPIPVKQRAWLPTNRAPAAPAPLDACFTKCRELTDRSKAECFDVCRD